MKKLDTISKSLRALAIGALIAAGAGIESAEAQDCAAIITHESRTAGESWSTVGEHMFYEDGIPVSADVYTDGGGSRLVRVGIGGTPHPDFGSGLVALYEEATARYNIAALGLAVDQVRFEALSQSQLVNIGANGASVVVGPLDGLDGVTIAPGATLSVTSEVLDDGSVRADVIVMGQIKNLTFGGALAALDNLCVVGHEAPILLCDQLASHASLAVGATFGAAAGNAPGDLVFVENDIEARVRRLRLAPLGPGLFGDAVVQSTILPSLDGKHLQLTDIAMEYSVEHLGRQVRQVTFRYYEPQRFMDQEMIQAGGERYVGQIADLPVDAFSGVTASVGAVAGSPDGWGIIRLLGDVRSLRLGGELLHIDEVCFLFADEAAAVKPGGVRPSLEMSIFPNPCNPRAEIRFRSTTPGLTRVVVHDVAGRRVRTLMDNRLDANEHVMTWDGRDEAGRAAATGMYFVRIETPAATEIRKLALIK